ncbi:hypothetical protein DIE14_18535 [Burkholderia sp. Bp9017]|uniref:tail fiber domain-containing protein n=1 Tax=unclassified Burkholderia TaxID=2613784 RepID=UPI000F5EA29F|nr:MULTISPECIES: hypothetical protein [unclassified Burkholderia]RQZ25141.1 hypothetical protein DIE14_18535 [Burkholderia sp. Bp9017]RQZ33135.1 hypothetical protein DIE13_18445 [Burkholderia sp. Bp9016]
MATTKLSKTKRRLQFKADDILPIVGDGTNWAGTLEDVAKFVGPYVPVSEDLVEAAQVATDAADRASQAADSAADSTAAIGQGSSAEAGDLFGSEIVPMSRGTGLLQSTVEDVAAWGIKGYNGFTRPEGGAGARPVEKKLIEIVSVKDWPGDPLDHEPMFSAAAQNAPAIDNVPPPYNAVPHPMTVVIEVPADNYKLPRPVNPRGRDVVWVLKPGANVDNIDNLTGTVVRDGFRKTKRFPLGTLDQACGASFTVGGTTADKTAAVLGVSSTQQMADYAQRDAVALVSAAYSMPPVVNAATATYTATTATIGALDPDTVKRLLPGMVIYTGHATRCCGILQDWSADGSELRVLEWRAKGGTSAVIPADMIGLTIAFDKIWGGNDVINLTLDGSATQAIGREISVRNQLGDSSATLDDTTNCVRGLVVAAPTEGTAGYYKNQAGVVIRGNFRYGFVSQEQDIGVYYRSTTGKTGYQYYGTGYGLQFINPTNGYLSARWSYTGDLEIGTREAAAPSGRNIRMQSGGFSNAYDGQISVTGGAAGSNGAGTMALSALKVTCGGDFYPSQNNVRALGLPNFLWTVVRASSGTIETSDGNVKALRSVDGAFTDIELTAWGNAKQVVYQLNDAIASKGADKARYHSGYIAQALQAVFAAHGLDASKYGFWCEDEITEAVSTTQTVKRQKMTTIDETVDVIELVDGVPTLQKKVIQQEIGVVEMTPVVDEHGQAVLWEQLVPVMDENGDPVEDKDGNPELRTEMRPMMYAVPVMEDVEETVEVQQPVGKRLALRYGECAVWEAAYMRARVAALEARVLALENASGGAPQTTTNN